MMKDSKARVPKNDTKADLQKLWDILREKPPGKIVGIRSKVVSNGPREGA